MNELLYLSLTETSTYNTTGNVTATSEAAIYDLNNSFMDTILTMFGIRSLIMLMSTNCFA